MSALAASVNTVTPPGTFDSKFTESLPPYVCSKCGNTIPPLGGYTVHYTDLSNPENGTIECDECCPPSPNTLKWILQKKEEEAALAAAAAAEEATQKEEDGYSSDDYGLDYYGPNFNFQ